MLLGVERVRRDLGAGDGLEGTDQEHHRVVDGGSLRETRRPDGKFLQSAAAGNEPDAGLDQADGDSSATTARALCITISQPPPSAMPFTAATVGTSEYLSEAVICWKRVRTRSAPKLPAVMYPTKVERLAPAENGGFGCQTTRPL